MKKIIRLTESDLTRIVKRTIREMDEDDYTADDAMDEIGSYIQMVGCSEGRSRLLDDLSRMVDEAERELSEEEFDKLQDYVYDLEQDIYETCSDEEEEESFYESDITRIVKRVIDEGKLEKSTKQKDLDVKMDGFRDKIKNYLKSKDCTVKQVGTDFEIHCDKKHVGQVMFRRDHIVVKKKGNKFGRDFGFDEMGRIKAELNKVIRLTESDLTRIVKQVIKENEEDMIRIPKKYDGVRMELGRVAHPQDIIEMYNELVEEGTPLVDYSEEMFYNEDDEEIPTDVILDELNYAIVGEEEDYDEEEDF